MQTPGLGVFGCGGQWGGVGCCKNWRRVSEWGGVHTWAGEPHRDEIFRVEILCPGNCQDFSGFLHPRHNGERHCTNFVAVVKSNGSTLGVNTFLKESKEMVFPIHCCKT